MKDTLTKEILQAKSNPLTLIAEQISYSITLTIARRIKEIGTLSATDVIRLQNSMRITDYKGIEKEIVRLTGQGVKEIEQLFDDVAKENDRMAQFMYDYRGVNNVPYNLHTERKKIVEIAIRRATKDFLHLSDTTAIGIVLNDNYIPYRKAYNMAIDTAVLSVQQGLTDYNSSMRHILKQIGKSGVKVKYESGVTRRLDSAVRMNVLDGVRQMNLEYREQQAKEYGADGWEISAHALCRPDHQDSQGKVFSKKAFEELQSSLETPIATGELNCKHTKVGVIMAINQPAYTQKELQDLKSKSNEQVTFTGLSGKEITKSRYECSQYMRALETRSRELKGARDVLKEAGDTDGARVVNAERRKLRKEYKRITEEMGLTARKDRL